MHVRLKQIGERQRERESLANVEGELEGDSNSLPPL